MAEVTAIPMTGDQSQAWTLGGAVDSIISILSHLDNKERDTAIFAVQHHFTILRAKEPGNG